MTKPLMSRNGYKSLTADVDARDDLISPLRRVVELSPWYTAAEKYSNKHRD
jgi:hypothetical protein